MFMKLQKPFDGFRTDSQCFDYLKSAGTYIPPREVLISLPDAVDESQPGLMREKK